MVNSWLNNAHHYFTTTDCVLCGAASGLASDLCESCQADLPINQLACPRCALPLPHETGVLCGQCQTQPPYYQSAFVPYRYESPLPGFITGLKFNARLSNARLLGTLLRDALLANPPFRPDCLLPVPLHPHRLRQRGFNQALEISRPIAKALSLPLLKKGVHRYRDTRPQSDLDGESRRRNMRNVFRIEQGLNHRHVAIIDDVITTGTTVNELARVLKKAGVETVHVWAVARA